MSPGSAWLVILFTIGGVWLVVKIFGVESSGKEAWQQLKNSSPQQKVLLTYLVLAVIVSLYVPCNAIRERDEFKQLIPMGYKFLGDVPASCVLEFDKSSKTICVESRSPGGSQWIVQIDYIRILLELLCLTAVAAILVLIIKIVDVPSGSTADT